MQPDKRTESRKAGTKKKSSWEPVKIIVDKETNIAARVSRLPIKPHPEYSYEIGRVDENDTFRRFLKPRVSISEGKVEMDPIKSDVVVWAMEQAEIYIIEEVQKRESELQLQAKSRVPARQKVSPKKPNA